MYGRCGQDKEIPPSESFEVFDWLMNEEGLKSSPSWN